MARANLWAAARTLEQIRASNPERFDELAHLTSLNESEITEWQTAATGCTCTTRPRESISKTTIS